MSWLFWTVLIIGSLWITEGIVRNVIERDRPVEVVTPASTEGLIRMTLNKGEAECECGEPATTAKVEWFCDAHAPKEKEPANGS